MSRQTYELKATVRTRVGKGSARALRRDGLIPAVIYGDKKAPQPIAISVKETSLRLYAGGFLTTVATIDVEGEKVLVLPKDYSRDPVKDFLIHVDFQRIAAGSTVTVWVPLHSKGEATSPGLKKGGALNWVRKEIECTCPAENIPEYIEIDVSGLDIAESLHLAAIKLPEGVKAVIHERDFTVVSITPPAGYNDAA